MQIFSTQNSHNQITTAYKTLNQLMLKDCSTKYSLFVKRDEILAGE